MAPPFKAMTSPEFSAALKQFKFVRQIDSIHVHHTWRPNHAQYRGEATIRGMYEYHTQHNGWSDIAQHVSVAPDGTIWSGRDWNRSPASEVGFNGTAKSGPFMFETIGDFDDGRDPFDGPQKDAVLSICVELMRRFQLSTDVIRFHNQLHPVGTPPPKTCPGTTIDYTQFIGDVKARFYG